MSLGVSFSTFGCKLNQLKTEALAEAFSVAGIRVLPGSAPTDLVIFNTCTVTAQAEARARRALRLAREARPGCLALLTGCWAELAPGEIVALGEGVYVLPGSRKADLFSLAGYLAGLDPGTVTGQEGLGRALQAWLDGPSPGLDRFSFNPESFVLHSRPSLKLQDGCDNACAYCRVSQARGASVSLDPGLALERLRALESAGKPEVVLTGVNLSQYRAGGLDFSGLLGHLLRGTSRIALRLSSWEADRVDGAFLEAFSEDRIRPHLHLALQSGSDSVLAAMGRGYGRAEVVRAVEALRRVKGDPFIAADLIVGFPGEGEGDFLETLDLARSLDLAWIQAFCFSPRPSTRAASLGGRVDPALAESRRKRLADLAGAGRRAYLGRWLGREVEAVAEGRDIQSLGRTWRRATSANYLRLALPASESPPRGSPLTCTIGLGPPPPGFDAPGIPLKGLRIPGRGG